MAKLSPTELAAKWAAKFGASGEAYKTGVNKVQESPAQSAIAAQDRLVANFNQAVQDGRWASGLSKVTLQGWKQSCVEKGAAALATSARVAMDKVARAEQTMGPIRDSVVASLPPRGTIEENLERARQMAMKMHEARRRG